MKNIVISIGREYGSGGKYIGKEVAKRLNINCYDKELIQKIYEKNGGNYSKLLEYDEMKKNKMLKTMELLSGIPENAFEDDQYQVLMDSTIKELAESESCVIIGRNSNNILKDYKNVIKIFIYSNDLEFKVKRKMEIENLSYEEALKRLKNIDKQRRKYYENVSKNSNWGDRKGYDFLIDSSVLGIEKTVDLIIDIYNHYQKI
ncbi:MAG: cytidylate kinase-like family protein [Clostridia bacterium]|nr:cytidylate kinase-like family protein [Clostridia bacterium]